ncbi:putative zinc metalloproteinase [Porphyridium purpureum]|uniref:Putative zinc metalloproteinase n=1 Tax=Porphyridium purpureum TaxID=35688 RepID=A0A5J4YXJ5_PORPP|nr:putative zinc metalloproteinase [Porphyridium purpureum]|eukprot:POR5178..scf209_3
MISVSNVAHLDEVCHRFVVLRGDTTHSVLRVSVSSESQPEIVQWSEAVVAPPCSAGSASSWLGWVAGLAAPAATPSPAPEERTDWCAVVELFPGKNTLMIASHENADQGVEQEAVSLQLVCASGHDVHGQGSVVRLVYLIAKDGDGTFQVPREDGGDFDHLGCSTSSSLDSGLRRLRTCGGLIQSALGELLIRHELWADELQNGNTRRSFALDPEPVAFRSTKTTAELHAMDGHALWSFFYEELHAYIAGPFVYVAVMSFTRFDRVSQKVLAHTALGGGALALFGGGSLFTWPESVTEVAARFLDNRAFDAHELFKDNSGIRGSDASTTIGAMLHELCHCFGCAHLTGAALQEAPDSIMQRGFDHLRLLFLPDGCVSGTIPVLDRSNAVKLALHPCVRPRRTIRKRHVDDTSTSDLFEVIERPEKCGIQMQREALLLQPQSRRILAFAPTGIRYIGLYVDGDCAGHIEPPWMAKCILSVDCTTLRTLCAVPAAKACRVELISDSGSCCELTLEPDD